jgi:hypothetical protein
MSDQWIWIPNWDGPDGFQHYRNRDPIWIKNYTRLLSHDAYMDLSFTRRGILHGIWMEYASSARRLRGDTLTLTRRLGQKVSRRDLESLNHAGFIELLASNVLAERLQDASPHARPRPRERREEKEQPVPVPEPELHYAAPRADPDIDLSDSRTDNGAGAGPGDLERINSDAALASLRQEQT